MTKITTDSENTIIEVEIDKINVEILENNIDLNIQINKNIVEIVNATNEVIVNLEGIQGSTGDSNILGKSPIFTYNSNSTLASVVYANGAAKTFIYNSDSRLSSLNSTSEFDIITQKTFNYNSDGYLTSIVEIEV